ncbi:ExbD/TolR family protein [Roseospira goensis]|uniref:Biopolymer transport protein ExbD n=1 Tax=Roseospira goensis TaxID=391922 RepID=A0A7W6WJU2_9PROT|nr:biopolymer transporter ExbD [Roseospira goensis]MBB4284848.1 biopolymer transport protein ExbD [Roseospira goensis]
MRLRRSRPTGAVITLTPLVDVLLILLVFFMVTSRYLNLDMIPMVERGTAPGAPGPAAAPEARPLLLRLAADGGVVWRGEALGPAALTAALTARVAAHPETRVLVLPAGDADAQALVSLLERATRAGIADVRVVRLEDR